MNENKYLENQNEIKGENSFMKKLLKKRLNQKGLTLIELLAVIVILAIIAAIAVPAIGNIINNSRDKAVLAEASNILAGAKVARTDNACGTPSGGTLVCSGSEIKPFVEGIALTDSNATATYTEATSTWSLQYSNLANIKNTSKFTVAESASGAGDGYTPPATTISEVALNKALNK